MKDTTIPGMKATRNLKHRNKILRHILHNDNFFTKVKFNIVSDLLLKFKQMPIEMLLKPLIGIVYTKLFKAVILQRKLINNWNTLKRIYET